MSKLKKIEVKVINKSINDLPAYETKYAAGLDLRADIQTAFSLKPLERRLVPTGLFIEVPVGYEAQVRPRSGLSIKHGITVHNAPGTIDADYRGEVGVILVNLSNEPFTVNPGDRIAQIVFCPVVQAELTPALFLSETERGKGGFGHTGRK